MFSTPAGIGDVDCISKAVEAEVHFGAAGCFDDKDRYRCRPRAVNPARLIMALMATSSKRAPSSKSRQSSKLPAEPSAPPIAFLRFYHSAALRKKTLSLLGTLEQAQNATVHREALADLVIELTSSGMDCYFMRPLKLAKPGFIVEQSANLGLAGVQQVMGSVVRQIIGRMEGPQLISVCGSIRQLML